MSDFDQSYSNNDQQQSKGNRPIDTVRDGALKLAIFRNSHEKGDFYSLKASKLYKDKQGETKETSSMSEHDALRMSRLYEKGYDRVKEFKQEMKQKNSLSVRQTQHQ